MTSDSESIKNKKPRSNRSCGKAKRDGTENENTPSSVQLTMTSDTSEDTTLVEISPSTLQAQPTITSLNNSEDNTIAQSTPQQTPTSFISEDFSTSRESTPCPVIQPSKIPCFLWREQVKITGEENVEMTDEKTEQDLTEIDQLPCATDLKNRSKRNTTKWRMI